MATARRRIIKSEGIPHNKRISSPIAIKNAEICVTNCNINVIFCRENHRHSAHIFALATKFSPGNREAIPDSSWERGRLGALTLQFCGSIQMKLPSLSQFQIIQCLYTESTSYHVLIPKLGVVIIAPWKLPSNGFDVK